MSDEVLDDKEPFGEQEKEDNISPAMVRKATYLIHKLADRRGADYIEIQKKCKKHLGYENLAKVTMEQGHAIIDTLINLTGGEEEQKPQLPTKPDDGSKTKVIHAPQKEEQKNEEKPLEEDKVTSTMRSAVRAAVDITLKEVVEKEVPVQGLGGFVLEIGKVIFEAKMAEEANE